MANAQGHRACGSQSIEKDPNSRDRTDPGLERRPFLPCVQMLIWCHTARVCAAPAYRGIPGIDADDARISRLDRAEVRHVRPAALHALVPSHRRPDALHVASPPAELAANDLIWRPVRDTSCSDCRIAPPFIFRSNGSRVTPLTPRFIRTTTSKRRK